MPLPNEGIKWGEDPERDCAELKRLEGFGLYPSGHHDQMCPICSDEAIPVRNELIAVVATPEEIAEIEKPREEITD
jgi:hypothetical protein